jgi:hypothetical protein
MRQKIGNILSWIPSDLAEPDFANLIGEDSVENSTSDSMGQIFVRALRARRCVVKCAHG